MIPIVALFAFTVILCLASLCGNGEADKPALNDAPPIDLVLDFRAFQFGSLKINQTYYSENK
jgi:hypothetical protein